MRVTTDSWKTWVPFGLISTKPRHFRDMWKVVWENRSNLPYAWKVLSKGVCDGCALGVSGFHDWTIDGVHLCMTRLNLLSLNTMHAMEDRWLGTEEGFSELQKKDNQALRSLGRLAHPWVRRSGERKFTKISWQEALSSLSKKIRGFNSQRIAFFVTSRGITNEVYYVAQKVARFIGTNHIENAARLCHAPSTGAMKNTLGWAAATCSYSDWIESELIVIFGSNPANDQPVAMKYLALAKKRGAKIIVVNPYREPGLVRYWVPSMVQSAIFGTGLMDMWVPVSQGGDIALLYGVIKDLIEQRSINTHFVENHTESYETLEAKALTLSWDEIENQSGVPIRIIKDFSKILAQTKRGVFIWSMGITQHQFGADAVQMILNLGLLMGFVGKKGCGLVPIRGHSGVQGGSEMGCYSTALPGGIPVTKENAETLSKHYQFTVPSAPGLISSEMVDAAYDNQLDLLYCVGGNFLRTLPNPSYVKQATERIPLRVYQDIVVTDQMFIDPKEDVYLLPSQTRYEQEGGGTETTTERRVLFSPEIPRQVGEAKAEWRILLELAKAIHPEKAGLLRCETAEEIRKEIATLIPLYDGIQNLKRAGDHFQYGGRRMFENGIFQTKSGKANIRAVNLPVNKNKNLFKLSTRRGKQFNSMVFAARDPLTGFSRDAILMNPDDALELKLFDGARILLRSTTGTYEGSVHLGPIQRRNLQVHWPEANQLLAERRTDPVGGVPDYNASVEIQKL